MRFAWPSKRASNRAVFRSMRRLPVDALQAPVEVPIAIFQPAPQCSHVARLMRVSRPPSRSSPTSNPHSNRCQPVPNCPRLRALALFRRRPPERVVRSSVPASKNLHTSGLMHCSKQWLIRSPCQHARGRCPGSRARAPSLSCSSSCAKFPDPGPGDAPAGHHSSEVEWPCRLSRMAGSLSSSAARRRACRFPK